MAPEHDRSSSGHPRYRRSLERRRGTCVKVEPSTVAPNHCSYFGIRVWLEAIEKHAFSEFWELLGGRRSDKLPQQPDIGYPNARNRSYSEEWRVKGAALVISKGKPPFDPKVF